MAEKGRDLSDVGSIFQALLGRGFEGGVACFAMCRAQALTARDQDRQVARLERSLSGRNNSTTT